MTERDSWLRLFEAALPITRQMEEMYEGIVYLQQQNAREEADAQAELIAGKKKLIFPIKLLATAGALLQVFISVKTPVFILSAAAVCLVYYFVLARPAIARLKPDRAHAKQIAKNDKQIELYQQRLNEIVADNARIMDYIPSDYHYTEAIAFFLKAVQNRRADSIKEAINLYEQELDRRNLIEKVQRQHEEQMSYLQAIGEETTRAANNAASAAAAADFNSFLLASSRN